MEERLPGESHHDFSRLPGLALLFGEIELPADFRRRAKQRKGNPFLPTKDVITLPLSRPVPRFSEFAFVEPQGAPDNQGVRHHTGLDWFAPTGTVVRAPVGSRIIEANPATDTSVQVFGGRRR